mmetsp:Transcript_26163/g.59160  ORF Transcript_26163/g.59160 Transcript_26163/m.59160 type:complete len:687 (+) Transcript_26163:2-2062(+)
MEPEAAQSAAQALAAWVSATGGKVPTSYMTAFYEQYPEHKEVIGSLASFTKRFKELLQLQIQGDTVMLVSLSSEDRDGSDQSGLAEHFLQFLRWQGGDIPIESAASFVDQFPQHRGAISSVSDFVRSHCDMIGSRYDSYGNKFVFDRSTAQVEAPPARQESVAQDFVAFMRSNGMKVPCSSVGQFYEQYPQHHRAIPNLKDFVKVHKDLIGFLRRPRREDVLFCRVTESKHAAQDLAAFLTQRVQPLGGYDMAQFYDPFPEHQAVITGTGLREFVESHGDLLGFADNGAGGFIFARKGPKVRPARSEPAEDAARDPETARALAAFVDELGGSMPASRVDNFKRQNPQYAEALGKIKPFVQAHQDILHYTHDGGAGVLSTVNPRRQVLLPARVDPGPVAAGDPETARALAAFVHSQGGSIPASRVVEFKRQFPHYAQALGKVKPFALAHQDMLHFEPDGGCGVLSTAKKGRERALVEDLVRFIRELGGRMSGSQIGQFYGRFPAHKGVLQDLGGVKELADRNFQVLEFIKDAGAGTVRVRRGSMVVNPGLNIPAPSRPTSRPSEATLTDLRNQPAVRPAASSTPDGRTTVRVHDLRYPCETVDAVAAAAALDRPELPGLADKTAPFPASLVGGKWFALDAELLFGLKIANGKKDGNLGVWVDKQPAPAALLERVGRGLHGLAVRMVY